MLALAPPRPMSLLDHLKNQLLQQGATGEVVSLVQRALTSAGLDAGKIDGVFGEKTLAAVKAFQRHAHLEPNGVVGPETLAALADQWTRRGGDLDLGDMSAALGQLSGALGELFGKRS